jgi:hypothetical protein
MMAPILTDDFAAAADAVACDIATPVSDITMTDAETAAKILGNALRRIGTSLPNTPAPNLRTWTATDTNVRFESSSEGEMVLRRMVAKIPSNVA